MRMVVVSIYDQAVGAFGRPAFVRSEGEAVRSFTNEVNRAGEDNPMHGHPEHFALWFLGHYDDATGTFKCEALMELVKAVNVKVAPIR